MGQPRIILFNFIIFKHKYDRKNCRIRIRFVGLEGNYADHLATITTASPGSNFDSFSMKTSKNDKRSSLDLINLFDHERRRLCARDSNLGLQDGRHWRIHWAFVFALIHPLLKYPIHFVRTLLLSLSLSQTFTSHSPSIWISPVHHVSTLHLFLTSYQTQSLFHYLLKYLSASLTASLKSAFTLNVSIVVTQSVWPDAEIIR